MRKIFYNAQIVDVVGHRIFFGWFSVVDGYFEFVEEGNCFEDLPGIRVDLNGAYVVPGLIDAHMHIESSLVTPQRFAAKAAEWGTCAVLQDPHEMANVLGVSGISFMIEDALASILHIYTAIPSCVPPTRASLETTNFQISSNDVEYLATKPRVIALGEVMDYCGILNNDEELLKIVNTAKKLKLNIEGHCPTLKGRALSQYISVGVSSDHTFTYPEKILEELQKGMYVMLQPKSLTKDNVEYIIKLKDRSRILLVTDDTPPTDLTKGHLNRVVRLAISRGWDCLDAIASATIRPAQYLGIKDIGIIAPGKIANFFTTHQLETLLPKSVFLAGEPLSPAISITTLLPEEFVQSLKIRKLTTEDFRMLPDGGCATVNVIVVDENTHYTKLTQKCITFQEGYPNISDEDLALIAVFYRSSREPQGSVGLISGLGLQHGAFCTSFAHDSHNLLIIGREPYAMAVAANAVIESGGGIAVSDGKDIHLLRLPIGGIITDEPVDNVANKLELIETTLNLWGLKFSLSFLLTLTLTTSPYYKISDKGIVDVERRLIIPIISELSST